MKFFILVASMAVLANARPEAGYSYQAPRQSAPAPSNTYGGPSGGGGGGGGGGFGGGAGGGGFGGGAGAGGFGGGAGGFGGGASSGGFSSGSSGFSSGSSGAGGFGGSGAGGFGGSGAGGFGGSGAGGFGGSSGGSAGFGGSSGGGAGFGGSSGGGSSVTVTKHIYVHVAPQEQEVQRPRQQFAAQQAQKHYKIIFIKAPSAPAPTAPVIPSFAQDEQKTLIYVLVKKPEDAPEIDIPTVAPTQPSKPEVYFIKYKTQKEAGGAIGSGQGAGSGAGVGQEYGAPPASNGGPY